MTKHCLRSPRTHTLLPQMSRLLLQRSLLRNGQFPCKERAGEDPPSLGHRLCLETAQNSQMSYERRLLITGPDPLYETGTPIPRCLRTSYAEGSQLPRLGELCTADPLPGLCSPERSILSCDLGSRVPEDENRAYCFRPRAHPCLTPPLPSPVSLTSLKACLCVCFLKCTPAMNHSNPNPCLRICWET